MLTGQYASWFQMCVGPKNIADMKQEGLWSLIFAIAMTMHGYEWDRGAT